MKRWVYWIAGFVVLFLINALVELVVLPMMGLVNTEKNDVYFMCWWAVVAIWFVFGNAILDAFAKPNGLKSASQGRVGE